MSSTDLTIVMEYRFLRTPDGAVWTEATYARPFWERYLAVFDRVQILARVRDVQERTSTWRRVDGDRVSLAAIPHYLGPTDYFRKMTQIRRAVADAIRPSDSVILRVPGNVGNIAARILGRRRQPFAVEVVGDPWDAFSPSANEHLLRPFIRVWFRHALKLQCRRACAALYVTERTLQMRYPPPRLSRGLVRTRSFDASDVDMPEGRFRASNVEMPDGAFVESPRVQDGCRTGRFRLVCVASMAQPYKGHDVLLQALARVAGQGVDCELVLVGDGRERPVLERMVEKLGLSGRVAFRGQVSAGDEIRKELDQADLFVLPSRVEGMPRALIEAMGRGLPSIASAVGGIPEVLPTEALVPPNDAGALAERLLLFARDAELRRRMAVQNLHTAQRFRESELRPRREAFYAAVQEATRRWNSRNENGPSSGNSG